jgi:hypothetical protein
MTRHLTIHPDGSIEPADTIPEGHMTIAFPVTLPADLLAETKAVTEAATTLLPMIEALSEQAWSVRMAYGEHTHDQGIPDDLWPAVDEITGADKLLDLLLAMIGNLSTATETLRISFEPDWLPAEYRWDAVNARAAKFVTERGGAAAPVEA